MSATEQLEKKAQALMQKRIAEERLKKAISKVYKSERSAPAMLRTLSKAVHG